MRIRWHQCGVLLKRGSEIIAHALRLVRRSDPGLVVLQVDCSNAFNTVRRSAMWAAVREHLPELRDYFQTAYGSWSAIACGDWWVECSRGGFQGDPLMPILFSLALINTDKALQKAGLAARFWLLDDFFAVGSPEAVAKAFSILEEELARVGIAINMDKSHTYALDPTIRPTKLEHKSWDDFKVLGTAIEANAAFAKLMKGFKEEVESLRGFLEEMEAQVGFCLLRSCCTANKVNHILRTCPPDDAATKAFWDFDEAVIRSLASIIGCPVPEASLWQCWLPTRLGGIGLRSAAHLAPYAFLAGACDVPTAAARLQVTGLAEDDVFEGLRTEIATRHEVVVPSTRLIQKDLTAHLNKKLARNMHGAALEKRDQARLLSVEDNANTWLNADPVGDARLPDPEFSIALRFTLGLPVYDQVVSDCPDCREPILDRWGMHALNCRMGSGRNTRHNQLCATFADFAEKSGLNPLTEQSVPCARDIVVDVLEMGMAPEPCALDFGITNPARDDRVVRAATEAGYAARQYAEEKIQKEQTKCAEAGWRFVPMIVETYGRWDPRAEAHFIEICRYYARRQGCSKGEALARLKRSLAVCRVRCIAQNIVMKTPHPHE